MKVPSTPHAAGCAFYYSSVQRQQPQWMAILGGGGGGHKQRAIQHIYPAAAGTQGGIVKMAQGAAKSTARFMDQSLSLGGMFSDFY